MLTAADLREKLAWAIAEKTMKLEAPIDTGSLPGAAVPTSSQIPNADLLALTGGAAQACAEDEPSLR
jgi:hypothetical protein